MSFEAHIKNVHPLWSYVYFVIGLLAVDDKKKNGIELEIDKKVDEFDLSWLPLHRTKYIAEKTEEDDLVRQHIERIESRIDHLLERSAP